MLIEEKERTYQRPEQRLTIIQAFFCAHHSQTSLLLLLLVVVMMWFLCSSLPDVTAAAGGGGNNVATCLSRYCTSKIYINRILRKVK
jgi:hypothetical protein